MCSKIFSGRSLLGLSHPEDPCTIVSPNRLRSVAEPLNPLLEFVESSNHLCPYPTLHPPHTTYARYRLFPGISEIHCWLDYLVHSSRLRNLMPSAELARDLSASGKGSHTSPLTGMAQNPQTRGVGAKVALSYLCALPILGCSRNWRGFWNN